MVQLNEDIAGYEGFLPDTPASIDTEMETNNTEEARDEEVMMKSLNTTCGTDVIVVEVSMDQLHHCIYRDYDQRSHPPRCSIKSDEVSHGRPSSGSEITSCCQFVMYYFTLLFLLCFATPVLITTSLNVYISSAVRGTQYDNISNHQWLTLAACVVMWLPCLAERMLSNMGLLADRLSVSVFLFLLGHTHNLLRSDNPSLSSSLYLLVPNLKFQVPSL